MNWPDRWLRKTGRAAATPCNTPRRFTSIIRFQSASSPECSGALIATPATLANTSRRPNVCVARSTSELTCCGCVMSVAREATSPPLAAMASAMAARSSSPRDPSTTRAPRAASSRAVAAPIPRPAPVTATTFPETCLSPTPVTEASTGLRADEVGDDSAELFAGVFLQKVARAGDHRVVDARRARHGALEDGSHGPGDRVAIAEGHQKRLVPL